MKDIRDELWELQSLHINRDLKEVLKLSILLVVSGLSILTFQNYIAYAIGVLFVSVGLLGTWGFIHEKIVDNAVAERLGWVDYSLHIRHLYLKDKKFKKNFVKEFTKEQIDRLDTLFAQKERPTEIEYEDILNEKA